MRIRFRYASIQTLRKNILGSITLLNSEPRRDKLRSTNEGISQLVREEISFSEN
ncbi:mCG1048589 [Mus musculus]|nr:mCG1048589 [Mus musculus]